MRVFPLSNWTELDIWAYILRERIPIVPLYFAAERPIVDCAGPAHHGRRRAACRIPPGETPEMRLVRFRTLGCYPLTGAVESNATSLEAIVAEMIAARTSERGGRLIDQEASASMEKKKREGYF